MIKQVQAIQNTYYPQPAFAKFMDDFKPSYFMHYVSFCISHKATVKRMKNKSKRSK